MRALIALLVFVGAGCSDLPDLGTCGNGIIEAELGEACDGDVAGADTCTDTCELACQTSSVSDEYVVVSPPTAPTELYCPDARMACGLDGICRGSSGQFTSVGAAQPFNTKFAVPGDFDGDGIADLIGTSATEILVRLGASTPFTDGFAQAAPSSDAPLAIFDKGSSVEPTGLAVAVPTDGLALLSSDTEVFGPDLDLSFEVNDTNQAAFVVTDPAPAMEGSQAVMAVARTGTLAVQRIPLTGAHTQLALPACGPPNSRLIAVAVARDQRSFVVVGRPAGAGFFLCHYTPQGETFVVALTTIAAPAPDAVAFAQLDDDPCPDLAFSRLVPPPNNLFMVPASPGTCSFTNTTATIGDLLETGVVLGAGSIVPGGRDELVLDSGVYERIGTSLTRVIAPTSELNTWGSAALVDVNGDGQLDVVASRKGQDDVDIVRGGAVPNSYRADTTAPVVAVTPGDFDGDFVGDVALIELNPASDQRISILYGAREGLVTAPVVTSKFGGTLRTLRLGRATWGGTKAGADGVDDLIVVRIAGGAALGGVMVGDPARIMTVPRLPPLGLSAGTTPPSVGLVAVGNFAATSPQLLAATIRPDLETPDADSLISTNDIVTLGWTGPVEVKEPFEVDTLRAPTLARTASGGMVGVFSRPESPGPTGATDPMLALVGLDGRICTKVLSIGHATIRAADLIGDDGLDELVVTSPAGTNAQVFPVTGDATCTIGDPVLGAALEGCADVVNAGDHLVALCVTDAAARRSGLFRIDPDGTREANPLLTIDGIGIQLVTGDFDGDGVLDIAVLIGRAATVSVQFLKQCPAHDTRGCQ